MSRAWLLACLILVSCIPPNEPPEATSYYDQLERLWDLRDKLREAEVEFMEADQLRMSQVRAIKAMRTEQADLKQSMRFNAEVSVRRTDGEIVKVHDRYRVESRFVKEMIRGNYTRSHYWQLRDLIPTEQDKQWQARWAGLPGEETPGKVRKCMQEFRSLPFYDKLVETNFPIQRWMHSPRELDYKMFFGVDISMAKFDSIWVNVGTGYYLRPPIDVSQKWSMMALNSVAEVDESWLVRGSQQ